MTNTPPENPDNLDQLDAALTATGNEILAARDAVVAATAAAVRARTARAALRRRVNAAESLVEQQGTRIESLRTENDQLGAKLGVVTRQRDEALAKLDELTKPAAPSLTPVLGACPAGAVVGYTAAAAQGVVDRFGDGTAVRLFGRFPRGLAPRPARAGHVHVSLDHSDDYAIRPTVADYVTGARNLRDGLDGWERQHESDAKVRKQKATLEQAHAALAHFAETAVEARPLLNRVVTFTGWLFSDNPTAPGLEGRNAWLPTARLFDVVGVDLDGVHQWPYPAYGDAHIANVLRFLDAANVERFAVPELGFSRNDTHDPTGTKRMDTLATTIEKLDATGRCAWIDLYLYESTKGNDLNPAEVAIYRDLVAAYGARRAAA